MKKKILFIGDSLIKCSNLKKEDRWVSILKNRILEKNLNYKLYDKSINGITTEELLNTSNVLKKNQKIDFLIISIGTNDSVYWKSKNGSPRTEIKKFKKNLDDLFINLKTFSIINKAILIPHLFEKKTIEINNKTHNQNIVHYKTNLIKIAKLYNIKVINMTNLMRRYNTKNYCEDMPDGIHLNSFGSLVYSKIIFNYIITKL